jgi:hypothetical protein
MLHAPDWVVAQPNDGRGSLAKREPQRRPAPLIRTQATIAEHPTEHRTHVAADGSSDILLWPRWQAPANRDRQRSDQRQPDALEQPPLRNARQLDQISSPSSHNP